MPTTIAILTPNGLTEAPYQADSLADAARYEGTDGVYSVASTFKRNRALLLDAHLDRMEKSAHIEGIPLQLDRPKLRQALRTLIERSGYENSRFRITARRDNPKELILTLEPFDGVPDEVRANGVVVKTVDIARQNPQAKTTDWMAQRAPIKAESGAYECIIVNENGELLEGLSSNFYAIWHGILYTAPDGQVLSGISRQIVMKVAPDMLAVKMEPITRDHLALVDEAFLTSASRGVIPIVCIDDQIIRRGNPGPLTQQLASHYDAWVENHLEPI